MTASPAARAPRVSCRPRTGRRSPCSPSGDGPPLVLVHGAAADHTTFRVIGPLLARGSTVHAIDRRGRGASGDTSPYAIEREFEDVAAVADGARAAGRWHRSTSSGTRMAVDVPSVPRCRPRPSGGSSRTRAPRPRRRALRRRGLLGELAALAAAGRRRGAPRDLHDPRSSGMTDEDLAATAPTRSGRGGWRPRRRSSASWPSESGTGPALEPLGAVEQPVLQVLGGDSLRDVRVATAALDERLSDGRDRRHPRRQARRPSHPPRRGRRGR